jgi:ATP-dependent Clp protease protease subunit
LNRFWNWARDADTGERVLYLDGIIAAESWFDDEITPGKFREELMAGDGDITIWLNSAGGDCIAASQIYSMLMDYKGSVTIKIDGLAASAASVIAMSGTKVLIAPTALMFLHNPSTIAWGNSEEMLRAKALLDEVKESIINAYQIKTNQSRDTLSEMMDAETWLSANKAVELGFADGVLEDTKRAKQAETYAFSQRSITNSLIKKVKAKVKPAETPENKPTDNKPAESKPTNTKTTIKSLNERLNLISGGNRYV